MITPQLLKLYILKKNKRLSQAARLVEGLSEKQIRIKSLESDRALSESKYQLTTERNKRQELIIYSLIGGVVIAFGYGIFYV